MVELLMQGGASLVEESLGRRGTSTLHAGLKCCSNGAIELFPFAEDDGGLIDVMIDMESHIKIFYRMP